MNEQIDMGYITGVVSGLVDEYGHPVKRTKLTNPYTYDAFVEWRGGENREANGTIYSDRLLQRDFNKHDRLCEKHFGNRGQYWDKREPSQIEAFLRDWTECKDLKLILVMQYCNQSSGYPLWRFDYHTPTEEKAEKETESC